MRLCTIHSFFNLRSLLSCSPLVLLCNIVSFSPLTQLPINVDLLVGGPANIQDEKIVSARVLRAFYRLKNQEEFDSGKGLFVSKFKDFIHYMSCFFKFLNCTNGTKPRKASHVSTCVIYQLESSRMIIVFITKIQLSLKFNPFWKCERDWFHYSSSEKWYAIYKKKY